MKILLFASAYNTMTQRFHVELTDLGHDVSIELAISDAVMMEAIKLYQPNLIIRGKCARAAIKAIKQTLENFTNYNKARRNFVYKVRQTETPQHLAKHRQLSEEVFPCQLFMVQ